VTASLHRRLMMYQYLAALCDTSTGVLLVAAPAFTLGLMGLTILPAPLAFVRYIGVFVLSVGLTYFWAAFWWPLSPRNNIAWSTQWKITALIRSAVALFVLSQVASRAIEARWITVAVADGLFASIQIAGLRKGWLARAG